MTRNTNMMPMLLLGFTAQAWSQTYTITTVAGAPPVNATSAPGIVLYAPEAIWIDKDDNVCIADSGGRRVLKGKPAPGGRRRGGWRGAGWAVGDGATAAG